MLNNAQYVKERKSGVFVVVVVVVVVVNIDLLSQPRCPNDSPNFYIPTMRLRHDMPFVQPVDGVE